LTGIKLRTDIASCPPTDYIKTVQETFIRETPSIFWIIRWLIRFTIPRGVEMDPSGARKYVYEPLSYNRKHCRPIRLLRVLPGKPDTPICCKLFNSHIRIVDNPQIATSKSELFRFRLWRARAPHNIAYNALSYVWGNAEDRVTIRVNGKDFSITRNL